MDGVADLTLERADTFFVGLALGDLALEVRATFGVRLAELADRGHMQRVVELAVAALGEPVDGSPAGGELDGAVPL